jgi:hypothetical protein
MENSIKIPKAWVLELDDLGWDNGRDLRFWKKASRSGIPRNHTLEDYRIVTKIGEEAGMSINVALCLGDWDKDNVLRGMVGVTHNPYEWDRASEIDIEKFEGYRDTIDNSDGIDFSVHGLLHGHYDSEGKLIHEKEYFEYIKENGETRLVVRSIEDFNRRLDAFFKIYDSWGFKKQIKVFISPCGLGYMTDEELSRVAGELHKRGIRYWTNGFNFEENESMRVVNGVVCCRKGRASTPDDVPTPWNAYDVDPTEFGDFDENQRCVFGLHWTNVLRFDPKKNIEQLKPWVNYIKRQSEIFGLVNAKNIIEAMNQHMYYCFAKTEFDNGVCKIDLSEVERQKVDCHKNEFFISFKNGTEPKAVTGGKIELYQTKKDFKTYKVAHDGAYVEIAF